MKGIEMTTAKRLGLIAVLTVSAIFLTRSSHAQTFSGSYTGIETVSIEESSPGGQNFILTEIPPVAATMSYSLETLQGNFGYLELSISGYSQGGLATWGLDNGGNLLASIVDPRDFGSYNGINNSAGLSFYQINVPSPGWQTITYVDFQASSDPVAVPEPSSIVHAALGVLMIAIFAWYRGVRPRLSRRPAVTPQAIR
jgi:hypothetical protein